MPATQVECCGELWSVEDVLEKHLAPRRNSCEWTYELAAAMLSHSVAHPSNEDPSRISTTTLTSKCVRRQTLERHTPYTVQLADLYAAFRGTLLHGQLEKFVNPACYGEVRFFIRDIGKQLPAIKKALPRQDRSFSGSPDLVDPNVGILYDYKRKKEVPRFNYVYESDAEQLNVNRWLVDNADAVQVKEQYGTQWWDLAYDESWCGTQPGLISLDVKTSTATWDMRNHDVRARFVPVEWQELVIVYVDDKGPKPITATESIDVPTKTTGGTKKARVPVVWSDERVEEFITSRYIEARLALTTGLAPVPDGWENRSHPLCNYCAVRSLCASLEAEGK